MKLVPLSAAVLAAALTLATGASAQIASLPLPAPPIATNPASSAIFDAMLAIARAAVSNPAAAQQATFTYRAAIQQYDAGDYARARQSAIAVLGQTAAPPLPRPSLAPPPIPQPSYYAIPNPGSTDQATAEAYVALDKRTMTTCGAPNTTPPAAIQQQYALAVTALVARNYQASRTASATLINQCGAATQAYATQQAAKPRPPATPIPLASYSPLPIATMIPDPALQSGAR